ncbi:uncharacterized protein HGUI_02704 [Hanseniaspora guilliermondii]|uniref:Transcription activator GCR1-like domain-containing protein n=1 Tax=Hanseniaspora guilliermondii TaxID=56406 RepID=A0A1L0B223_9ASCO|nr:uncharacterized protein HGUI_02704 [Hanseniaspora guilliermondii]
MAADHINNNDENNIKAKLSQFNNSTDENLQTASDNLIKTLILEIRTSTLYSKRTQEMFGFLQSQLDKVVIEQKVMNEKLECLYSIIEDELGNQSKYDKLDTIIKTNQSIDNYMVEFINVLNKNYSWNLARNYIVDNAQEMESLFSNIFSEKEDYLQKAIKKRINEGINKSKVKLEPLKDESLIETASENLSEVKGNLNKIWKAYNNGGKPNVHVYKMSRDLTTVTQLADEYFVGINGLPSVMNLDLHFGALWRKNDRSFYSKRMIIINKIKDVVNNPRRYEIPESYVDDKDGTIPLSVAVRVIENIRLGNNKYGRKKLEGNKIMSLNRLYIYFKGKLDTLRDYDVNLSKDIL